MVTLKFGDREWKAEAALVSYKDVGGKGLLAVNVSDSVSLDVMCAYAERERLKSVAAVETRSLTRGRNRREGGRRGS